MRIKHRGGIQKIVAALGYVIWPAVGFFLFGLWGSFTFLFFAFVIDLLLPKWAVDLEWKDVVTICENMAKICPVGAKGFFVFPEGKFYVIKVGLPREGHA